MKLFERSINVLESFKKTVENYEFLLFARRRAEDFSRNRKMNFSDIMYCMLNFFRKEAQIEVDEYLINIKRTSETMSEQAFLKARQKILPVAFTMLNDVLVNDVYANPEYFYKYKGYRLLAIDGTILTLNNSKSMRDAFGGIINQASYKAAAQASCLYDVENGIIVHSIIEPYKANEKKLAVDHIKKLEMLGSHNDLILFDRGYPSSELIETLSAKNLKFLMRVSSSFLKPISDFKSEDGKVKVRINKQDIYIRVIQVVLETGEIEKLITNIFDESLTANDFKELYYKRWAIETRYDFLKNKLEIENFTGDSKLIIEQDFYASIYLANLCEVTKACSDEMIENENSIKNLKLEYKTNQKRLIAKLKNNLILIVAEDNLNKKQRMLKNLIKEIHKKPVAIVPGRRFERARTYLRDKFTMNKKRAL